MRQGIDYKPLLLLFGYLLAGMFLAVLVQQAFFSSVFATSNPLDFLAISFLFLVCSFGLPAWVWLKQYGCLVPDAEIMSKNGKTYFLALALFLAHMAFGYFWIDWFTNFLSNTDWSSWAQEASNLSAVRDLLANKSLIPLVVFVIAVVPAIVEEFFFRRIIFSFLLSASRSFWIPAILSSLVFAGMHNHLLSFIPIFLMGLALCFAYYTTKNIWISIGLHALNNTLAILVLFFDLEEKFAIHWIFALISILISFMIFRKNLHP